MNTTNPFETIDNTGLTDLLNTNAFDDDETTDGEDNYSEEICGLTGKIEYLSINIFISINYY